MGESVDAGEALGRLLRRSESMHPDGLEDAVRQAAEDLGGRDVELLVVDLSQRVLLKLGVPADSRPIPVDGSTAGDAYRNGEITAVPADGQVRLWLPLMDSAERLGVMGVTVAAADENNEQWHELAALAAELIAGLARFGDTLVLARRTRDTTVAAEMRWAALPPLTFRSPLVTVTGILEPAYEIAGDTFDYAVNRLTVHAAIFDAMGHGLEASRMANLAVTSYRHSRRAGLTLQQTIHAMDQVVADQFGPNKYVTGQLSLFDTTTGDFRLLNMGHPLPLLIRGGRVVGEVECRPCPPIGLGAKSSSIATTRLQPGDAVLLYTDGITEARAATGEWFGSDRLTDNLNDLLAEGVSSPEVLRRVVGGAVQFQDYHPRDDATLLMLHWHGPPTSSTVVTEPGSTVRL